MSETGLLLIVSGPSGVGKGTICHVLLDRDPNTVYSVSATTRQPRPGELDGVHYHFLDRDTFLKRRDAGEFLEWAEVYGNYYGTLRSETDRLRQEGRNVLLEIDTQGAKNIKATCPDSVSVFILPPSIEELRRRIVDRGTESPESLARRQAQVEAELAQADTYDYRIVNDDMETAVQQLAALIETERQKRCTHSKEDICVK